LPHPDDPEILCKFPRLNFYITVAPIAIWRESVSSTFAVPHPTNAGENCAKPTKAAKLGSINARQAVVRQKIAARPACRSWKNAARRASEKVSRRRQIDPTTCEREYTPAELEFMHALDQYKRTSGRMFPTCSEVLEVLMSLGTKDRPTPCGPGGRCSDERG